MEVAPQTDVNEVSDTTKTEAVYQIPYSTTKNQTDRYYAQVSSWGQVTKKQQDKEQTRYANSNDKKGLIGK